MTTFQKWTVGATLFTALIVGGGSLLQYFKRDVQPPQQPVQSGNATTQGANSPAGVINNQGSNNTNVVGNQNRVDVNTGPKTTGWLSPASDPVNTQPCSGDDLKGAYVLLHGSNVSYGHIFPRVVLKSGDQQVVVLDKDAKGRIALTADIFGADGKIVASVVKNKFQVNPNNYFYLESDNSTLRVIDQYKQEVIFIRYMNSHVIKMRALLYLPGFASPIKITDQSETFPSGAVLSYMCIGEPGFGDILIRKPN